MLRKRFCHNGCRRTQNARLAECRVSRRKAPVCVNRARSVFNKRRLKACRGRVKRRPRDTEVGSKPADKNVSHAALPQVARKARNGFTVGSQKT